jgi:hypothetical protein
MARMPSALASCIWWIWLARRASCGTHWDAGAPHCLLACMWQFPSCWVQSMTWQCACRSGATDERAKEAGLINKSLSALGRVINAIVDKTVIQHGNVLRHPENCWPLLLLCGLQQTSEWKG